MRCEWDYTCPHCGKTNNVTASYEAPSVGDVETCRFCGKLGKIIYEKLVYQVDRIEEAQR